MPSEAWAIPRGCNLYVDESVRGDRYLLAAVAVRTADVATARSALRARLRPAQRRLHFATERPDLALGHLEAIGALPLWAAIAEGDWRTEPGQAATRRRLLAALLDAALPSGVQNVVLDRWDAQDRVDTPVLLAARHRHDVPALRFDHLRSADHELLWAADGVAWAMGRGGRWAAALPEVHRLA